MKFFQSALQALAAMALCQPSMASASPPKAAAVSPQLVATVPGNHFENIAIRRNGDVLLTSLSSSTVYLVPRAGGAYVEVATLPNVTALLGIAELKQDVFYVSGTLLNGQTVTPGSNALWEVDLRKMGSNKYDTSRVRTRKVADLPSAGLLNGMCRLSPNDDETLLVSDSFLGAVSKINVKTGSFETTIQDPTMAFVPEVAIVGLNGIRIHQRYLYFASTGRMLFARVPIDLKSGKATGPVEVLVGGIIGDDFVLSRDGRRAYLTTNIRNSVLEIDIAGKSSRTLSNSTLLTSATSVTLGRTASDKNSLYFSASSTGESGLTGNLVRLDLS